MKLSPQAIGLALRAVRDAAGMTLAELSAVSGIAVSALSRLENGHRRLDFSESVSICDAVGVDLNAIHLLAISIDRSGSTEKILEMTRLQQDLNEIQRLAVLAAVQSASNLSRS